EAWLTPEQRQRARIPATVRFQEKWRLALTLLRQVRASGISVTGVLGDAEFGDNTTLRRAFHRAKLPYALGVSSNLKVFVATPPLVAPAQLVGKGRPRTRPRLAQGIQSIVVSALAREAATREWRIVTWRNGTNRPWRASFLATALRADGRRLCVAAAPASAPTRQTADLACRARGDHGDSHGAFLRDASALSRHHAETQGNQSADLTK